MNYSLLYGSLLIPNFMLVNTRKQFAIFLKILIRTGVFKRTIYVTNQQMAH